MIKLTDALCETIYTVGVEVVREQTTLQDGATDIHRKTGMDIGLANIYIRYFTAMIAGEYCGFVIDGAAIEYFAEKIIKDFGYERLTYFFLTNKDPILNMAAVSSKYMSACAEHLQQVAKKPPVFEIREKIQTLPHEEKLLYVEQINLARYTPEESLQITQCIKADDFASCMNSAYHVALSYTQQGIVNLNVLISFMIEFQYTLCQGITPYQDRNQRQLMRPLERLLPKNFTTSNFLRVCKALFPKTTENFLAAVPNQNQKYSQSQWCHMLFCCVFDDLRERMIAFVGEMTINKYGGHWVDTAVVVDDTGREHAIWEMVDHRLFESTMGFLHLCMVLD